MSKEKKEIDIFESGIVPKHEVLSEEEKAKILEQFGITLKQLPRIKHEDPVVKRLGAKKDDIIKITRKSPISGEYDYYRVVVESKKK